MRHTCSPHTLQHRHAIYQSSNVFVPPLRTVTHPLQASSINPSESVHDHRHGIVTVVWHALIKSDPSPNSSARVPSSSSLCGWTGPYLQSTGIVNGRKRASLWDGTPSFIWVVFSGCTQSGAAGSVGS